MADREQPTVPGALNRLRVPYWSMKMTTETTTHNELIDEFLEKHGAGLPGHVIDFALDLRSIISELEAELERLPAGV